MGPAVRRAVAVLGCIGFGWGAWAETPDRAPAQAEPAGKAEAQPSSKGNETKVQSVAPLAARDVIERLKTIRSEIVLEQETVHLLKVHLERLGLESQVAEAEGKGKGKHSLASLVSRKTAEDVESDQPSVRFLTLQPFKEAIVVYRGRSYTVRVGDKLGPYEIVDMNEGGIITSHPSKGRGSIPMGGGQ